MYFSRLLALKPSNVKQQRASYHRPSTHIHQRNPMRCYSAASPTPAAPPLTRIQREAQELVAIDVVFAHVLLETGQRLQIPVEVCIVDWQGNTLLHSLCNGFDVHSIDSSSIQWEFKGGVRVHEWISAPPLSAIMPEILKIIGTHRPVLGHNVGKDITALGLDDVIPLKRRRDTMRYAALQGPTGLGRTLAELTENKLGRKIQKSVRHDPAEDAIAALDLYLKYCHYDPALMEYDDLVEYYESQIIISGGNENSENGEGKEKID